MRRRGSGQSLLPSSAGRPLSATPETPKKDNGTAAPGRCRRAARAWQDRTGSAAQQAEALAIYQRPRPPPAMQPHKSTSPTCTATASALRPTMSPRAPGWRRRRCRAIPRLLRLANMCRDGLGGGADYPRALALYRQVAESGNGSASPGAGRHVHEGHGRRTHDKAAVEWFRRGADAGHPGSMYSLGLDVPEGGRRSREGRGQEALRWFEKAAASGYAPRQRRNPGLAPQASAQKRAAGSARGAEGNRFDLTCSLPVVIAGALPLNARKRSRSINVLPIRQLHRAVELGDMYRDVSPRRRSPQAVLLYERAAQQGEVDGSFGCGMYFNGPGSTRDYAAARWFGESGGYSRVAELRLARMYRDGLGGDPDYARALDALSWMQRSMAMAAPHTGSWAGCTLKGIGVEPRQTRRRPRRSGAAPETGHPGSMRRPRHDEPEAVAASPGDLVHECAPALSASPPPAGYASAPNPAVERARADHVP